MNVSGPDRSAKEQLREQLIQAARRDVAQERRAQQPRRRRRRRRGTGLIVAVVLGGAAAAGAADLISAGDPVPDTTSSGKQYKPPTPGAPELVAKAPDPQRGTAWGVGIYTADNGQQCAIAGQVRGVSLGLVRDGVFRAYASGSSGACADLKRMPMLFDRLVIDGPQPRTIVFGRTRASDRTVITKSDGKVYSTKPGRGGGFLFVFEGRLAFADVRPRLGPPIGP